MATLTMEAVEKDYKKFLLSIFRKYTYNSVDAEDMYQDFLLNRGTTETARKGSIPYLHRYDPSRSHPTSYLFYIATNWAIRSANRRNRNPEVPETDFFYKKDSEDQDVQLENQSCLDAEVETQLYVEDFMNMVRRDHGERAVKILEFVAQGLTWNEISNRLGIHPTTISKTLKRVRTDPNYEYYFNK